MAESVTPPLETSVDVVVYDPVQVALCPGAKFTGVAGQVTVIGASPGVTSSVTPHPFNEIVPVFVTT